MDTFSSFETGNKRFLLTRIVPESDLLYSDYDWNAGTASFPNMQTSDVGPDPHSFGSVDPDPEV